MKTLILVILTTLFSSPSKGGALAAPPKILVILSEADAITLKNGKTHPTGYYLSELMVPLSEVMKLGYKPFVVTPFGKKPSMDRTSDNVQSRV